MRRTRKPARVVRTRTKRGENGPDSGGKCRLAKKWPRKTGSGLPRKNGGREEPGKNGAV